MAHFEYSKKIYDLILIAAGEPFSAFRIICEIKKDVIDGVATEVPFFRMTLTRPDGKTSCFNKRKPHLMGNLKQMLEDLRAEMASTSQNKEKWIEATIRYKIGNVMNMSFRYEGEILEGPTGIVYSNENNILLDWFMDNLERLSDQTGNSYYAKLQSALLRFNSSVASSEDKKRINGGLSENAVRSYGEHFIVTSEEIKKDSSVIHNKVASLKEILLGKQL